MTELLASIPPTWIILSVIGFGGAAAVATCADLPLVAFPRLVVFGILGSMVGQLAGVGIGAMLIQLGDVSVIGAAVGALLACGVVRRWVA